MKTLSNYTIKLTNSVSVWFRSLLATILCLAALTPAYAFAQPAQKTTDDSKLIVKFSQNIDIDLDGTTFKGSDPKVKDVNNVLSKHSKKRLFGDSKANLKNNRKNVAGKLDSSQANLDNYYEISLNGKKADEVKAELSNLGTIEAAYAKPLPTPAPVVPSYVANQKYLNAATIGMGVNAKISGTTNAFPGSNGSNVQVADIEYSWNVNHTDISKLRASGALWNVGTPVNPGTTNDHGTAVAGIIAGDRNGYGIDGIVPNTNFHMVNSNSAEYGWNVSNAVYTAANKMSAGDVILLEQQAWAPDGLGFAPIETYLDVYDAISYATAKGINVVEAAGNGKQDYLSAYDLSNPMFNGIFTTKPSSKAIIVGAGAACGMQASRSRMVYSNYGSRVNVQGYGECVTTTGYGDLNPTLNQEYTNYFNGTSSASATIAAVVAELSSTYKQVNGKAATPANILTYLKNGASAQNTSLNPGNIGPMPNMATALLASDVTAPTNPTNFTATKINSQYVNLKWNAATDGTKVKGYMVYKNGVYQTTVTNTYIADYYVFKYQTYKYQIKAVDINNNKSSGTPVISVTM